MKFSSGQQKLIIILFTAVISLLIIDVAVKKFIIPDQKKTEDITEVSGIELDKILHSTLNNFGFEESWIKETKSKKSDGDSVFKSYKLFIPKDLTIPVLLVDLFNDFQNVGAKLKCSEVKTGKETYLKAYSGNHIKLEAVLTYGTGERKRSVFGIMLNDFELNDLQDSLLTGIPEPFCVILSPSSKSADWTEIIKKNNKEYAVLLDDNISELKFKLSAGYSENRINGSFKSILGSFPKAIFFMIDSKSDLFNSTNGNFILSELDRRKIKHFNLDQFNKINEQPGNNIDQKFEYLLLNQTGKSYLNIIVEKNDFEDLLPEISSQRKRGVKFLNPSEVQFHRN